MRVAILTLLLVLTGLAPAQQAPPVGKPGPGGVPPRKMLYTYLQAEAQKHFDARRHAVAALKTPEDVQRRQQDLKAKFVESLGGFPAKTPLNARVVGKLQGEGFHVEKVIYESRPDHHVTANLYLPDGKPRFPGVLLPCGHSSNGKAVEAYQRAAILMAKNGLAVLCYDPIGQGERNQILDRQGKPIVSNTTEHTLLGIGALLVGRSTASYRIWDGMRSLDYLASRPEIDPKRLGCTGNSGGGTLTAYLMALDDRIAAAAPSCYITSLERLLATIGPQDAEQNITGQIAFGMDHADYLTMRAPRPTLMCVATQDFFDIDGAWKSFREAKLLYGLIGHGERMSIFEYNDKHGFSKPRREAALHWMRRWLLHKDDTPREGEFPVFSDQQLQCTRSGQVLEDFKGKSVVALNIEAEKALEGQRAKFQAAHGRDDLLKEVRRLIGLSGPIKAAGRSEQVGERVNQQGMLVARLSWEIEPEITVPALYCLTKKANETPSRAPLVLYLHGDGKAADMGPGGAIQKLVEGGAQVMALDLRGIGETAPGVPSPKRPNYLGVDTKEAFLGLLLNRPLLGQRVHDVLALVNRLAISSITSEIRIVGVGSAGPIALHAAALDPRIKAVTLERSLLSWSSVVQTPITYNQLTNVVPGALKVYDLPDLAATLAPRPLTIRAAVDAAGRPVALAELTRAYAGCRGAYARADARKNLTFLAGMVAP
jgi:cephalosporin-C deacetylase-like acetyl esterase